MDALTQLRREHLLWKTRRHFLRDCSMSLGGLWLAGHAAANETGGRPEGGLHFPPRAKHVIYLHMAGSPSQLDLWDYKPELAKLDGQPCPESFLEGKTFAFIQGVPNMLGPQFAFRQHGESGQWMSDLWKHLPAVADDLCVVRSMHTDQFNHAPAQLVMHTGTAIPGAPSAGSWSTYGLGSENENLPGFVVLTSGGKNPDAGKSVWGSGYLPGVYQGVQCRGGDEPVLFLKNPAGVSREQRRATLDALADLNRLTAAAIGDPETLTRVEQYELAFRMQTHAAEAFDLRQETAATHEAYGVQLGQESLANNCLLARRLVERGVRFVQLFDWGWDSHGASETEAINGGFLGKVQSSDRPIAALIADLKDRGLLDETLVVWSGEFGRTPMQENRGGKAMKWVGRDHNPAAFTLWMAGGGCAAGRSHGTTDEIGYAAAESPVSTHDFHATLLRLLGIDHERLTFQNQGAPQRLTNITKPGTRVIEELIG